MGKQTLWNSPWLYDADWWWRAQQMLWENRQLCKVVSEEDGI